MSKNVPKIRFPEFTGEWEEKKLGDTASYVKGYAFQSKEYKNKGIRVVRVSDTTNLSILPENNNSIYVDYKSHYEKYMLFKGDIIVSTVGSKPPQYDSLVGRAIYIDSLNEGSLLNQNQLFLKTLENYDSYFIYLNLKSASYLHHIISIIRGNANQASITVKELMQYPIKAPILTEQFKVADFLSTLDYRITNQSAKVDLLTELKKGTIQKIFSQEIRFKREDGSEYLEWEEKKLGEMGLFSRGHSYNAGNVRNEGLLVLRSNNIQNNKIDFSEKALQFVNKDCKDNIELKKNDIVICMANGSKKLVGKTAIYNGEYIGKATVGAFCSIFRGEYPIGKYLFQTNNYFETLGYLLEGTNISNLKNDALAEIIFEVPSEFEEQQKIADFLSTIDSKIDTETQILSTLHTLKKGLLQQMFV